MPEFGWLPHANGRRESSGLTMWAPHLSRLKIQFGK